MDMFLDRTVVTNSVSFRSAEGFAAITIVLRTHFDMT